jgi:hypothetical protein
VHPETELEYLRRLTSKIAKQTWELDGEATGAEQKCELDGEAVGVDQTCELDGAAAGAD